MINKDQIRVDLTPDKRIYKTLGHGQHEIYDALAELIDNSLDARLPEQDEGKEPLKINITIPIDVKIGSSLYAEKIVIEDNASGMDKETAKDCLVIARTNRKGEKQGKYGLGLKQSALSIGEKFIIITKKKGSNKRYTITFDNSKFIQSKDWSDFYIEESEDSSDWHGTKITIMDFWEKKLIYYNKVESLKKRFNWIFGPFIKEKILELKINGTKIEGEDISNLGIKNLTRINLTLDSTLPSGEVPSVTGWFGFREQGSVLGFSGFNLFRNGRLVKPWEKIGYRYHPEYRNLVGELHLNNFPVTLDKKDFVRNSDPWVELVGEERYNDAGIFVGYETKNSKLAPLIKESLKIYKEKEKIEIRKRRASKEEAIIREKEQFLKDLSKRKEELKKLSNVIATVKQFTQNKEDKSEGEENLEKNIKIIEDEQKKIAKSLPRSFLETRIIKINNKIYRFDLDSTSSGIVGLPYSLKIDNDKIEIIINLDYPFLKSASRDWKIYVDIMTILALSEAINRIKKENDPKILEKLFEKYSFQINELANKDIQEIDKNSFDISF